SDTVTYTNLATGTHAVQLNGVPSNCTVSEANPQTVTVPPGGSATAAFTITCAQLTGSVTVTTSTSGGTPDSNGYTVTVTGGGRNASVAVNSITTSSRATASSPTVELTGLASSSAVGGQTPPTATVAASGTTTAFTITCAALPPPTGGLTVTNSTTGQD